MKKRLKVLLRKITVLLVTAAMVITAFFVFFDKNLRTLITDYSVSKASETINGIVNAELYSYLNDGGFSLTGVVHPVYDPEMNIRSVETDALAVSKIKSGLVSSVQKRISECESVEISIPIGTIIGEEITINRGPKLKTVMQMSSVVHTDLESTFTGAGINQTVHRIVMKVRVNVYLVQPWYRSSETVECDFILAETVIVGTVPEAFTVVIESDESDTAGLINDYGAENHIK